MTLRQFTATALLIERKQFDIPHVLLIYHPKLHKWLPPGGHVEENELPHEAACRECFEETGIDVEAINSEGLFMGSIQRPNASSLPQPYAMLLENIPHWKDQPAHQHIDLIYQVKRLTPPEQTPPPQSQPMPEPLHELQWFSFDDLKKLKPDVDFFIETLELLEPLMKEERPLFE